MRYLKIFVRPSPPDTRRESLPFRLLMRLLPLANPDFDRQIPLVCTWLLEFERPEEPPVREIGLDGAGEVIAKMPHGQNYGY